MILAEQEKPYSEIEHYVSILKRSDGRLRPHFFLTGDTGSGKTHCVRSVARKQKVEFIEVNAAAITREGHSGNSLSKALSPLKFLGNKPAVVFVDEFDKALTSSSGMAHDFTADLQYEFLKLLEDGTIDLFADYGKYVAASVSKCMFIFGGSFSGQEIRTIDDVRAFGIRAEFIGRVGQVVYTESPSLSSLLELVDQDPNIDEYVRLFPQDRAKAVSAIQKQIRTRYEETNMGVRLVASCTHSHFLNHKPTNRKLN